MFEAGSILTTSKGGDLIMPTVNDTDAKATVVAEYQQSTKSAPSFGSETLKAYTYRTPIVPVSLELLQDSAFDLEALLSGLLAESFGRGINYDLTRGDGKGKPKGIVEWATASDAQPAAAAITLDNIIDLVKGVDSSYARHGRFMFNRNTLYSLVKIKDTTGRYIWQEMCIRDRNDFVRSLYSSRSSVYSRISIRVSNIAIRSYPPRKQEFLGRERQLRDGAADEVVRFVVVCLLYTSTEAGIQAGLYQMISLRSTQPRRIISSANLFGILQSDLDGIR